ncbi:MAG: glycine--tRNA ligase subunit beta, partial [Proteobacteria bacterium]|nr:glycine--tRNA ligase subunit beta [Pseudomonadota bacterium]
MSDKGETLLVELGTEELPPKALWYLSREFGEVIHGFLKKQNLTNSAFNSIDDVYATPRRLAVLIPNVLSKQETQQIERRGPSLQAAFDKNGEPSKAALGFAESCGMEFSDLDKLETDKGSWLVHRSEQAERNADTLVIEAIEQAIKQLPIPKRMRWG